MAANFEISLAATLMWEGGFSDDPHDHGGATMRGVTLEEFQKWFGADRTVEDLKSITKDQLHLIYHDYWDKVHGSSLPNGVDLSMFDMGVNAGPTASIRILQKELNTTIDGILGPKTMERVLRQQPHILVNWLYTGQVKYYRSLSGFLYFGRGWLNRANARWQAAGALAIPVEHTGKAV